MCVNLIFNSFLARGNCGCLLITFANNLDPDQDKQNVGPALDSKLSDTLIVCLKELFEKKFIDTLIVCLKELFEKKLILKNISRRQKHHEKLPSMQKFRCACFYRYIGKLTKNHF